MLSETLNSALDVFRTKSPSLIGVDISSTSIKLVELADAGNGAYRLERYAIEPLPKDVVTDGNIANLDQVSEALRRAHKRLGSHNRKVALALPAAMVITKKIIVPSGQKEEELELAVEAEANQYIPFALDEVNLDFQVLGPAPSNPEEVEVLIAASRKEKVEDRVAIAEAAGLKPLVMDVESYATQEAFRLIAPTLPVSGRDQNIALVDIGAHVTHFYVLRNDQFLFSRDQAFGGNQLTHDIQRAFNLSPEEAESAKKNQGLPENYDADVLQPFMETLALEITRALQFFFTSTSYSQVDHIVLAGGGALLPGLDELVAKRAGVATVDRQSLRQHGRVRPDPAAPAGAGRAAAADRHRARAAELRMIRINLLPHREQKRQARQRQFISITVGLALLALSVVGLVHVILSSQIDHQQGANKLLKTEIAKLDEQIKEIDRLREQTQALLARKQVVEMLQTNRTEAVHLLDQMVRQLPDGVYLRSLRQTGTKVTLVGFAQSNARVSTLMRNIETSPWLNQPELVEIKSVPNPTARAGIAGAARQRVHADVPAEAREAAD